MASNLLIRNVRPGGGDTADILIRDGSITAIGEALAADGAPVLDGAGRLALPGLVEATRIWTSRCWACNGTATRSVPG